MFYILCEDAKMGKQVWSKCNVCFFKSIANIKTTNGIDNYVSEIDKIPLNFGDLVFLAFDNIGSLKIYDILDYVSYDSSQRGYTFVYSTYYCIEETFLSFSYLDLWLGLDELQYSKYRCVWQTIYTAIKNNYDYSLYTEIKNVFGIDKNREQLASTILTKLTQARNRGFSITKSSLGKCWREDCNVGKSVQYCKANRCYLLNEKAPCTLQNKWCMFCSNSNLRVIIEILQRRLML